MSGAVPALEVVVFKQIIPREVVIESWSIGPGIVDVIIFDHFELVRLEATLLVALVYLTPGTTFLLNLRRVVLYPVTAL